MKKNIAWIAAVALCLSSSAALVYAEDDLSPAGSSLVDEDILEPVHIESKSTQKRVDMRNNTHSFSVNSFYLIVF